MSIISFQPGQPGEGMAYNVHKPLPYPIHVDTETCQARWGLEENQFLGLQNHLDIMSVDHLPEDVFADPDLAIGKHAVLLDAGGLIFTVSAPITRIHQVVAP